MWLKGRPSECEEGKGTKKGFCEKMSWIYTWWDFRDELDEEKGWSETCHSGNSLGKAWKQ